MGGLDKSQSKAADGVFLDKGARQMRMLKRLNFISASLRNLNGLPEFCFDISWEIYQTLKAEQEAVGLLDAGMASDHCWRPRNGAGNSEYIADFALAIRAPFKDSYEASRRILIELFYISLVPYEQARHRMGDLSVYLECLDGRD